ncbi:MAG: hypothetical protein CO108_21525 [Deltaproteobacteria bacterium CG_4_9_14_3_um_filter_63_12]|nr:MAG: hypothetical protein CO108_21525 [Deltaproteobacteria bacterium CG_4_9_14_3_um_filter_63_12]
MDLHSRTVAPKVAHFNARAGQFINRMARGWDSALSTLHLGGRKAQYDDYSYEFIGGANDEMRKKHYDKSLRLLWKAEAQAPWSSFKDATRDEKALMEHALRALNDDEKATRAHLASQEFRALLDAHYTYEQKQALVSVLSAIGHGEAYAWLVSADVLGLVKSTGARAALTLQVVEEAKHFVVLRELLQAFQVEIPPLSGWEYILLEQIHKQSGLDKLFGMNVIVEGIALSLFGMLAELPGLDVLHMFHLDESRHTAVPVSYLKDFPLRKWQRLSPLARLNRVRLTLPAIGLIFYMEKDLAVLGLDSLDFGGSVLRKVTQLASRAGFMPEGDVQVFIKVVNEALNAYAKLTRHGHSHKNFHESEATRGERALSVEAELFDA